MKNESIEKQAAKKVSLTRSILIMERPFFGSLIMRMKPVVDWTIPTMATDGTNELYNPKFVMETPEAQLVGIHAHEGSHVAYRHHVRMGDRTLDRWNRATDYVINSDLTKAGFTLPDWVLLDKQYDGLSAEEIYNLLEPDEEEKGGGRSEQGKGSDPGGMGGVICPCSPHDAEAIAKETARWEAIARQSVNIAKAANAGIIPGYLERLVDDLQRSKVDWNTKLRNFAADSVIKDSTTWSTPNHRFISSGLYIPAKVTDKLAHIVDVMDTSGSVDDKLLSKYAAELRALLDDGLVDKVTVIYADADVRNVQEFERGDVIELDAKGGGGTNFRPAMNYIAEHCQDASVILFFTDLFTRDFGDDPGIPVLWSVYGDPRLYEQYAPKIPFGETLYIS